MVPMLLFSVALIFFANEWVVSCLKLRDIQVPAVVIRGDPVWLNCSYDLEGDKLYSIKWHKNSVEFYRYLPEDKPPEQKYELPGVHVDLNRCREGYVYLYYTDVETEGLYRCEVSAEAPSFQTVKGEQQMRIYVFPKENPRISGVKPHYSTGEEVRVMCESAPSRPAAFLKWLINGKEAPSAHLYAEAPRESEGLLTSRLMLRFIAKKSHFQQEGIMRLQCEASIPQAHSMNSEEILVTNNATTSNNHGNVLATAQVGAPKEGPTITGGRFKYQVGDIVDVNCTASKSQPPAELRWYINDKEVRPQNLVHYSAEPFRTDNGQRVQSPWSESTVLGLKFEVRPRHFQGQEMRLRCTATLSEVIRMSSEELEVDNRRQMSDLHVNDQPGAVSSDSGQIKIYLLCLTCALTFKIFAAKT